MTYKGIVHDGRIDFDAPISIPEGTRVTVTIAPENGVRRGSPQAVLSLVGTLSDEEAEQIMRGAAKCRRVDPDLWRPPN